MHAVQTLATMVSWVMAIHVEAVSGHPNILSGARGYIGRARGDQLSHAIAQLTSCIPGVLKYLKTDCHQPLRLLAQLVSKPVHVMVCSYR